MKPFSGKFESGLSFLRTSSALCLHISGSISLHCHTSLILRNVEMGLVSPPGKQMLISPLHHGGQLKPVLDYFVSGVI